LRRLAMKTLFWAAALALIGSTAATAQTCPARPITIVAPFPPGGPSEALGVLYKAEIAKWWPIIMAQGLKVE
jgi:tripartite-type tricarboxylate transporter receptor subunit TctC